MMERLLHYTWKHKMLPLHALRTTAGKPVEVVDVGMYNRSDGGPDFFNAKVKIDGVLWVGNVELHVKASDWYRHHHDADPAYDNVVLHVVEEADMDVETSQGDRLPTVVVPISEHLRHDYDTLLHSDKYPPCYKMIPALSSLKIHSWMSALQTERLERKTTDVLRRVKMMNGSWEDAYFVTLARNFGAGLNGDAFEEWARRLPLRAVDHHRDDLFQVESLFIGVARMLDKVDPSYAREYAYLAKKFRLDDGAEPLGWRYLRTRPQNFPHVRVMQLAKMHHERRTGFSELLDCATTDAISRLYGVSKSLCNLIIINTVVPIIFAYGRSHAKEHLCERAFDLLGELKPEHNHIVTMWQECGMDVDTAGDSQALIQLKNEYCDRKECLRCRFGYEFLSGEYRQAFLAEDIEDDV